MYSDCGPRLDLGRLADEPRLTPGVRAVAAGARRRATRDGDRLVDTAHLLHSLLESDPVARDACDAGTGRMARVLGYLVQRSIGYGLRWSGTVEESGALPVLVPSGAAVPRPRPPEAGAGAGAPAGGSLDVGSPDARPVDAGSLDAGWSPAAAAAMRRAVALARRRGRGQADGVDLLDALAADPQCRAREVLRAAGLDVSRHRGDGPVAS
ncbi:Clp protease N-terminal domain-containing protein [Streptomyces sp. NPDC020917]|uniref:Clp protease N-terminal domain-containing protein n=1 Tax=Streptomyces sp. NPDC020917 TaxID=3365102 RepID=UPI0037AA3BDB